MSNLTQHLITYLTYIFIALFWGWWSVEVGLTETMKYPFVYVLFSLSFLYTMKVYPILQKEEEVFDPREESKKLDKLSK